MNLLASALVVPLLLTQSGPPARTLGNAQEQVRPPPSDAPTRTSTDPKPEEDEDFNPFAKRGYEMRSKIAAGLSGAFLVTSGVLLAFTWRESAKLHTAGEYAYREDVLESIDTGRKLQIATIVSGSIGVIFGVGAGLMYWADHRKSSADKPKAMILVPTENGVAISGVLP